MTTTVWVVDNRVKRRGAKASMTRRLIETLQAFSEDVRVVSTVNDARRIRYGVVVLSGSSLSIARGDVQRAHVSITAVTVALTKGIPVLGICFGFQLLAFMHGMRVARLPAVVRGEKRVEDCGVVYFHHQDAVKIGDAPQDVLCGKVFVECPRVQGVQFHPEATPEGNAWLYGWLREAHAASRATTR